MKGHVHVALFAMAALVFASACSTPSRGNQSYDAGTPDAYCEPHMGGCCGNGVVETNEYCDEGALNGTPQGTCTVQCFRRDDLGSLVALTHEPFPFSFPVVKSVSLGCALDSFSEEVVSGFDDSGVHVLVGGTQTSESQIVTLKVHSAPSALGRVLVMGPQGGDVGPLWIERAVPGVGGPWLLFATLAADFTPTIYEIPYPFPDGTSGTIISECHHMPVLIDQSATTNELLVAVIVVRSPSDVHVATARFPAAGTQRGVVAGTPYAPPVGGFDLSSIDYVQFFDDTLQFQTIEVHTPYDLNTGLVDQWAVAGGDYEIVERARGSWPFHVAQTSTWNPALGALPVNTIAPISMITDTGDIYLWQFDHSPPQGEGGVQPFAHVARGSVIAQWVPSVLWALQADGTQVVLVAGDEIGLSSPSLSPLTGAGTVPWTAASVTEDDGPKVVLYLDAMLYGL